LGWQSRDGRRYTALFVDGQGNAYGRIDEARPMKAPSAGDHGAFNPDEI
jgi:hypothetical protein